MKTVNTNQAAAFKASMKAAKAPAKAVASKKPAAKSTVKAAPAKTPVAAALNRLSPVIAADESAVMAAAFDGVRRRPVVAINELGELVVCCRRTATKNGWELQGTLFARNRTGKVLVDAKGKLALADNSKRAAAVKGPERRTTDTDHKLVPKKVVAKLAKTINEILA